MSSAISKLPFRYRLTLWYILMFTVSLLGLEALSYFEFKADLLSQVDAGLLSALNQAIQNIDVENNTLAFQNTNETSLRPLISIKNPYAVRIIDERGAVLDAMKDFPQIPSLSSETLQKARGAAYSFQTVRSLQGIDYRVATAAFSVPGSSSRNLIQISTALTETEAQLSRFLIRFSVAFPFVLIVAILGGLFLAWRALNPIVAMEKLAAKVHKDQLSERLNYHGPSDEIGKLSASFDAMLDRLEASFKREKRFSADASHELRTPLAALKGKMEVALSRSRTAREYEASISSMKDDVERLIALSSDLLLLSKASSADLARRFEDVDVQELVDSCVEQVIDVNPAKHIHVKRNYEKRLATRGVRDYLIRLFLNILDNAVKFSDDEVDLTITIAHAHAERLGSSAVLIEITDRGCGIPEHEIPKLFEPFYRVESDRSRARGGAGLGLAICKEIVETHGGEIRVESALHRGTTVTVVLPVAS